MSTHPRTAQGQAVGFAAFVWGYPLVESLRTCHLQTGFDRASWRAPIDRLHHSTRVSTDADRDVVTPANDLLYTTAWIHLADGPRLLRVPSRRADPRRYFVLALYDAWTNNFANPGFRESPLDGETIGLVGPDWPEGATVSGADRVVRAPTSLVWLIGRVLAESAAGAGAALTLQGQIELDLPPGTDRGRLPLGVAHWVGPPEDCMAAMAARPDERAEIAARFFTQLCRGLADQAIAPADTGMAAWFGRAGLTPSAQFDFSQLDEPLRAGLIQGFCDGANWLLAGSRSRRGKAWSAHWGLGRYGCDYGVRALTAYKGLGALAAEEAVYAMSDFDAEGKALDGRHAYQLRFPLGEEPPVDGFWSVTLYDADRFLYPNPLGRHSLGDRSTQLVRSADGSLRLLIGREAPESADDRANWLPAPPGPFYLILRMYVPQAQARTWTIPALESLQSVARRARAP